MSAPATCGDCGAPLISGGALYGRCARCLLNLAIDARAGRAPFEAVTQTVSGGSPDWFESTPMLGGRYRFLRRLARGGQGEVWHAYDEKLQVEVALKVLRPDLIPDERARERLRREVRIARQVLSPNVCRVFDLVIEDGHELISMEFVDGITLAELLAERGPLDLARAGQIAAQLLAGIEAIHAAGLVHGDVKPENVMLTLSHRVVVMDFGIARTLADVDVGTVAGTVGYMSPEQAAGLPLDARADVFSSAVVLAEMISTVPYGLQGGRQRLFAQLREEPPRVPTGPWGSVLRHALCRLPAGRYASAGAMARALELEQREIARTEENPYPGLLPFTRDEVRFFFGREQEVEALLRRLRTPRLRALIGPSGAGKSSFLQAGLLPALSDRWLALVCTPADRPFAAVERALAAELSGDAANDDRFPRSDDPGVCLHLAEQWRRQREQGLIVIDQAEELFTLNTVDVQPRFAELLGRFVLEADLHVILSLRDDFLLHCQSFEDLRPVFSDVMPLAAPTGEALRRALVQPALVAGYRFEHARLVDDMLRDVAHERGALPLLAFAMGRLWEHRDRERRLLTRRGYEEIGGVAGALARHAEVTLESIGTGRTPIVREVLRNLATAAGTRTPRDREELLSVFGDERGEAEEVLRMLVDARLLTSFETPPDQDGARQPRLEIVHESLLVTWPLLARWRDQDAEGARLRDQLRQAAHLWDERGRPDDLLWTGPSFAEYVIWKQQYIGRLSALEQSFARAMEARAGRRRFRTRLRIGVTFAILITVLGIVSQLWIRSRSSEEQALQQARRAEAQQLVALGQVEENANPTVAFAYALAALEREDTTEIRRFALRQLWKGPLYFVASEASNSGASSISFSTDGEWFVNSGRTVQLWHHDSSVPVNVPHSFSSSSVAADFTADGRKLVITGRSSSEGIGVDVLRLPDLAQLRRIEMPGETALGIRGDQLVALMPRSATGSGADIVSRSVDGGPRRTVGFVPGPARRLLIDSTGEGYLISYRGDRQVLASTLSAGAEGQRPVLRTRMPVSSFWIDRDRKRIVILDDAETLHLASLAAPEHEPRPLSGDWSKRERRINGIAFDRAGRWLAAASERKLMLWDLKGAPDAEPVTLGRGRVSAILGAAFDSSDRWLAAEDLVGLTFWPMAQRWPFVLRVTEDQPRDVAFDPEGKWIAATCRYGGVEIWPLVDGDGPPHRRLATGMNVSALAVSPGGKLLATGTHGKLLILSVSDSRVIEMGGFDSYVWAIAFDQTGRRIAVVARVKGQRNQVVRVFDLQTGETKDLDLGYQSEENTISFLSDGSVLTSSFDRLYRLNLQTGSLERLSVPPGRLAFLGPDRRHVLILHTTNLDFPHGTASVYDLQQARGWPLATHGDQVTLMGWDPSGKTIVTGSRDGIVRVGPVSGEEPHLLIGHQGPIWGVRFDPTGRLLASTSEDGTVRIWPIPAGQPVHTLTRDGLLEKLRSLTNVRIVPDATTPAGYRVSVVPFQGWRDAPPTW